MIDAFPFINFAIFIVWVTLLYIDMRLYKRRIRRIPNGRTPQEGVEIIRWMENSREMRIRRKVLGNVYWDGYNWLMGRKQ